MSRKIIPALSRVWDGRVNGCLAPGQEPDHQYRAKAIESRKACSKPEGCYTNWAQQQIAKEVGISQSRVFQIMKEADLKPHKIGYCVVKVLILSLSQNGDHRGLISWPSGKCTGSVR